MFSFCFFTDFYSSIITFYQHIYLDPGNLASTKKLNSLQRPEQICDENAWPLVFGHRVRHLLLPQTRCFGPIDQSTSPEEPPLLATLPLRPTVEVKCEAHAAEYAERVKVRNEELVGCSKAGRRASSGRGMEGGWKGGIAQAREFKSEFSFSFARQQVATPWKPNLDSAVGEKVSFR